MALEGFELCESCERFYHPLDIVYVEDAGFHCEYCYDELQREMMLEAEGQQGD